MIRRLCAGAVLGLLLLGSLAPGASAGVVARTAQTGYFCDIAQNGSSSPIDSDSMTLAMTLDVPTSVAPGERLDLRGELSLAFPESMSQDAKGFVTTANGYSDSMSLQLGVDGGVSRVIADRWQTPEIPVGDPIVVRAPIAFPPITIPASARGDVTLTMAQNDVLKNPNFATPATIAFAAAAQASGPVGTFNFNLSCYLKGGSPSTIARIPVATAAATHATQPGPASGPTTVAPAQAHAQGQTQAQTGGAVVAQAGAPAAGKGTSGRSTRTGTAPGTSTGSGSAPMTATYADTDASPRGGIYVPTGVLVGIGVLVCAVALGYAAWANYRLRALRRFLDD